MTTSRRVEARDAGEYRGALSIVGFYASHCFQCILSRRAVSFRDVSQYNQPIIFQERAGRCQAS